MYKFLRPLLFTISPESIHHFIVSLLRFLRYIPGVRWITKSIFSYRNEQLQTTVFGINFPNPVGLAAGFDKDALVPDMLDALGFGYIEIGSVTPLAQPGNPKPRSFRLPKDKALINRMGINNQGAESVAKHIQARKKDRIIGGNIGKNAKTPNEKAADDYKSCFVELYGVVDYFVVNVSCPNVSDLCKLQNQEQLAEIVKGLTDFRRGQEEYRPIQLKISPDLTNEQIDEMIDVINKEGLDGIVATNTTTKREGLSSPQSTVEAIGNGGLSGAPLTKRSLEVVKYIHEKTNGIMPIIGVGGIMTVQDALNMLDAGASLIQVYSGFIYDGPAFVRKICKAIVTRKNKAT
ncbi:MAG: quinone-dependent dihydroorotate dehydrogenase [Prevotellaceae bacterium]|nr:quinone-dependent dihydroorotate dehydrogenase [Prevotellaceae bacterium]